MERGSGVLQSLSAAGPSAAASLPTAGASLSAGGGSGGLDGSVRDATGRSGSLPAKRSASTKSDNADGKEEYTARVREQASLWAPI